MLRKDRRTTACDCTGPIWLQVKLAKTNLITGLNLFDLLPQTVPSLVYLFLSYFPLFFSPTVPPKAKWHFVQNKSKTKRTYADLVFDLGLVSLRLQKIKRINSQSDKTGWQKYNSLISEWSIKQFLHKNDILTRHHDLRFSKFTCRRWIIFQIDKSISLYIQICFGWLFHCDWSMSRWLDKSR